MNSNEALIDPEPISDAVRRTSIPTEVESDAVRRTSIPTEVESDAVRRTSIPTEVESDAVRRPAFTYKREDGTVEEALNVGDAYARCPFLGKLAIEAPEQASMFLELAALGNAKIAAEAKNSPKEHTVQEQRSEPKPAKTEKAEDKMVKSIPEQLTEAESSIIAEDTHREENPVFDGVVEHGTVGETEVSETIKQETQKEQINLLEIPAPYNEGPSILRTVKTENIDAPLIIGTELEQGPEPKPAKTVITEKKIAKSIPEQLTEAESPIIAEDTHREEKTVFDDVVEHSTAGETEVSETIKPEITDSEAAVLDETKAVVDSNPVDAPTFEAFFAEQPVNEKIRLEPIMEQSSEQAIEQAIEQAFEQTLVPLLDSLTQSTEYDDQLGTLSKIIEDIEKVKLQSTPELADEIASELTGEITPELADELRTLLRHLGFQNPRETLVDLISEFGFQPVNQSLTYLSQLTDNGNNREFLSIYGSTSASSSDDNALSRLSRLILELVMGEEALPNSKAA